MHVDLDTVRGEVINIGTGRSISVNEIAKIVCRKMGTPESMIEHVGDRPGQVFRHTADFSKARRLLGWHPRTSFEQGIEATIDWYRNNPEWWSRQMWMRSIPILTKSGSVEMH